MLLTSIMRIFLTRSLRPFHLKREHNGPVSLGDVRDLGLYVHIPFCKSLCSFCPYCKMIFKSETADRYKTALLKEIDLLGEQLEDKKKVTSLYFGGGTPALMIDDLQGIINHLERYFIISDGIGVELHPDDITKENIKKLRSAGVSMVSLGIQSFDSKCLNILGRRDHSFIDKMQLVEEADFDAVDVDLIFGIPNQTDKTLVNDIFIAFDNGATQVSTYPFIDFTFAGNQYKPMPERNKKKMLKAIVDYCRSSGQTRTSVWTFSRPNTKKYSSVTRDAFLGFGVSATTLLNDIFKINTFSVEEYINKTENDSSPTALTLNFTPRQRAVYHLFWSAYSMRISPGKFESIVGKPLKEMYGMEFWLLERLGLIYEEGGSYKLTDKAAYFYHYIEQAFTTSYIDKVWSVLRTVAFPDEIILK